MWLDTDLVTLILGVHFFGLWWLNKSSVLPGWRWSMWGILVHHKLIGFGDIKLQVFVVAPCEEALNQSPVLLCENSL